MRKYTDKQITVAAVTLIGLAVLLTCLSVFAQDTLVRDGATCDIPEGYNIAPYSADFNHRGMGEFCVFPAKLWIDAITAHLKSFTPPDLPECDGLSLGGAQVFPCYEVHLK